MVEIVRQESGFEVTLQEIIFVLLRFSRAIRDTVAKWLFRWSPIRASAGALRCVLGQDTLLS